MINRGVTQDVLQEKLKEALQTYWSIPENRKIDGKCNDGLLDTFIIQDLDYRIPLEGRLISQFEILHKALINDEDLPALQGRFRTHETIDNGNATRTVDCEFTLLSFNYHVNKDGSFHIMNLLTNKR